MGPLPVADNGQGPPGAVLGRGMPVGAVLDYQKDAASDTQTRFVLKLR